MPLNLMCRLSKRGVFKKPDAVSQADWEKRLATWFQVLEPSGTPDERYFNGGDELFAAGSNSTGVWIIVDGAVDEWRGPFDMSQLGGSVVRDYLADFEDTKLSPADKSRLDWGLTQGP